MDRRLVGVLVLVLAVVAALAGSGRVKEVSGTAGRGPVPGPPTVGDCLLAPLPEPSVSGSSDFGGGPGDTADPVAALDAGRRVGPAATSSCVGSRYGEVAAVFAGGMAYVPSDDVDGVDPDDPSVRCESAAGSFLGGRSAEDLHGWQLGFYPSSTLFHPDPVQQALGQRWVGCAITAYTPSGDGRYATSLAGGLRTLDLPLEFATCLATPPTQDGAGGRRTACATRHRAELFGVLSRDRENRVETEQLRATCPALVASMTGMTDPTGGGRLRIEVQEVRMPAYEPSTGYLTESAPITYSCTVVVRGDDRLTGPLLGVGSGSLPLG